jgi:hypothetical protein
MKKDNAGKRMNTVKQELTQWMEQVEEDDINETCFQ